MCYGGWPVGSAEIEFTVALESARGDADSIDNTIKKNSAMQI